jgi:hypothetical protein
MRTEAVQKEKVMTKASPYARSISANYDPKKKTESVPSKRLGRGGKSQTPIDNGYIHLGSSRKRRTVEE